jgi:hypothetical protein
MPLARLGEIAPAAASYRQHKLSEMIYPDLFAISLAFTTAVAFLVALALLQTVSRRPAHADADAPSPKPEPTWKPLEIEDAGYAEEWGGREILEETETTIHLRLLKGNLPEVEGETEASTDFVYDQLVPGQSVLAGFTAQRDWVYGVYERPAPGFSLRVRGPRGVVGLWQNLLLLRGALAEKAKEAAESGDAQKEWHGRSRAPDLDFWTRSGYRPWLYAPAWFLRSEGTCDKIRKTIQRLEDLLPEEGELHPVLNEAETAAAEAQINDLKEMLAVRQAE